MEPTRDIIRNLLLYEFQLGHDAQSAMRNINRAKGRQVVSRTTAFDWFAKFRADNTNLNDQPRTGRSREVEFDRFFRIKG
jgi:transposase